jgi:hypothetical protein
MAEQKWVAIVNGKEIGAFTTQKEAEQAEYNEIGLDALNHMIDSCSSYEGIDTSLMINYFVSNENAQTVVDYLQHLIDVGV